MYGPLITLAILFSLFFSERLIKLKGLNIEIFWQVAFWAILFGIIGARLYHVIDYWQLYSTNLLLIPQIWNGGLGIFGALIGGGAAAIVVLKSQKQNVWQWLNIISLPVPLSQAIGRLGNYFNNEIMPYAIYEAVADLMLFFALFYLFKKSKAPLFLLYIIGYSSIRFLLEPLKTDSWTVAGLNVAQIVSILLILISGGVLLKWKLNQKNLS